MHYLLHATSAAAACRWLTLGHCTFVQEGIYLVCVYAFMYQNDVSQKINKSKAGKSFIAITGATACLVVVASASMSVYTAKHKSNI